MTAPTGIQKANILSLPNEILTLVLGRLSGTDLGRCTQVSRRFNLLAELDVLWARAVVSLRLNSPAPYKSFKELYASLHRHLWLHGHVWHGDRRFIGYLLIARYSSVTGSIGMYNLLANNNPLGASTSFGTLWSVDSSVLISNFQPQIRFWEDPILSLTKNTPVNEYQEAQPLYHSGQESIACSLSRVSMAPSERQDRSMSFWPPITIPSSERIRYPLMQIPRDPGNHLHNGNHAAETLFCLRKWLVFNDNMDIPFERALRHSGVRGEVEFFSALDKELYTPDTAHPLRGLWVGDYHSHGCEFILFHQPTSSTLEGIKITGDINVPRGEHTFIISNLHEPLRIADEGEWPGAVVVRAKGQIASSLFMNNKFIDSEMIIINPNEVAFCWREEEYGHISKFKRLDIDKFVFGSVSSEQ